MAEEKKKTEKEEIKKPDELRETEKNKEEISETGEKVVGKKESKPAVSKETKSKKEEKRSVLEREYIIPLRRNFLKTARYKRAKKAVRTIKEFIARHMKVEGRDLKKVKTDIHLNNEIWFRGIKKPAHKIKVKAVKNSDGSVEVRLAEVPEIIQYKISREIKRKAKVTKTKKPAKTEETAEPDKDKDGIDDKVEEKEDKKSVAEAGLEKKKKAANVQKHTATGKHSQKTMPQRKALKK